MSQLVFDANSGGTITITGDNTASAFNLLLPAADGTLLFQNSSNTTNLINLSVSGVSTFNGFTSSADSIFSGTGQITLPVGNTSQRSASPTNGMIRYNSTYGNYEGYSNGVWGQLGGGATGGGSDQVFIENSVEVTVSYTLPTGKNALSVGPITVDAGTTVTVPSGQRWLIL